MPEANQPSAPNGAEKISMIPFQGKEERAVEVGFEVTREGWSEYQIADGSVVKLKHVVSRIFKLLDPKKDDGSPWYVLEGTAILTTIPKERELAAPAEPGDAR